ncbi:MAG: hypothetical protein D6725_07710 [Planctomycetota bacterium]|nr:MAG: hypothetical protein D6725_07710 [Planctomycetota bacterium]
MRLSIVSQRPIGGLRGLVVVIVSLSVGVAMAGPAQDTTPSGASAANVAGGGTGAPRPQPGAADSKYLLRFRFWPNQFVHYETTHRATLQVALQEVRQTTRHSSQTHKHVRVVTVHGDGSAVLETQIDWARLSAQNDDEPAVVFDSRQQKTACPPVFRHVAQSVGRPLARFTVSPRGLVRREPASSGGTPDPHPTSPDEPAGPTFLIPLPQDPVGVGDRWQEDFEVRVLVAQRIPQRVRLRRTFELVELRSTSPDTTGTRHGKTGTSAERAERTATAPRTVAADDNAGHGVKTAAASGTGTRRIAVIRGRTIVVSPVRDPSVAAQLAQRQVSTEVHFDIDRGLIVYRETKGDKLVVGPFGPASSIRAVMHRVERLVPPPVAAATASEQR